MSTAPAATGKAPTAAPPSVEPVVLRRRIVWGIFWGFVATLGLMAMRFFFPRTLFEPKTIFTIGTAADFGLGVETKFQQDFRVWVVKKPDRLFVIYARCTHLGCTPDWKQGENKFKCPCHGSGYDSDGVNFEGPAPRPMDRAYVELNAQGEIVVDTSRLYQCEKGKRCQFDDGDGSSGAYIAV